MKLRAFPGTLIAASLLALAVSPARADDWTHPRHDAQGTGATNERVRPPFRAQWTVTGATNEPLLVQGNTLYYTARRGGGLRDLVALDVTTRKPRWRLPNVTQTGAVSPDGKILCTIMRMSARPTTVSKLGANLWPCAIVGVDTRTGKVLWNYPIREHPVYPAVSPLTVAGGAAYLVNIPYCAPGDECDPGQFLAVNIADGKLRAKYEWSDAYAGQIGVVSGAPVLDADNSRVAFGLGYQAAPGSYGGQVWIFHADTKLGDGPIYKLGDPSLGTGELAPYAHKGGNAWPLLGGSTLAVQGPEETTRVWDVSEFPAKLKWEIKFTRGLAHSILPGGVSPLILEHNSGTNQLSAMYLSTGKRIWTRGFRVTGLSATADGAVYVPAQERPQVKTGSTGRSDIWVGVLVALDTTTGRSLWSHRKPDVTFNTPIAAHGRLYVSDSDGVITCFASGAAPAAKPAPVRRKR